jgi:GxxExxY protein
MRDEKVVHKELSHKIVGLAMQVHRELGSGFLEKVYENAMMVLLRKAMIPAVQQASIQVCFQRHIVGEYYADILAADTVVLELKSVARITPAHKAQALNYLKATGKKLAIILNFGKESLEYERLVF